MSEQPDLSTAAQALEDAYERIGDLGGSAAEVKLTVSWVTPSGRPMSLSIGDVTDLEDAPDEDDDIEYDDDDIDYSDAPHTDPTREKSR